MLVRLEPHNPAWALEFAKVKASLENILSSVPVISIVHVGSTSIPNLLAKPVLDIAIVVTRPDVPAASSALEAAGYAGLGELGVPDRWCFRQPGYVQDSYFAEGGSMKRNTYVTVEGCRNVRNHLDLKKVLLEDESLRDEYAARKRDIVDACGEDGIGWDEYCARKTEVILKILRKAGWSDEVSSLNSQKLQGLVHSISYKIANIYRDWCHPGTILTTP